LLHVNKVIINSEIDKLLKLLNSKYDWDLESELLNFENEDEKKLFYLTRVFTRINRNINHDLQSLADKGINNKI